MMKTLRLLISLFLCSVAYLSHAQSCANYTVSRSTGITYTSIAGSGPSYFTWRNTASNQNDDNRSYPVSIGFDFWYLGVKYTTFSGNLNGVLDFSSSTNDGNNQSEYGPNHGSQFSIGGPGSGTLLALAPIYVDLWTAGGGVSPIASSCVYKTTGTAPNRVLTVEWINFDQYYSTTGSYNFQVKLYETSGAIEFVYGTMTFGTYNFGYTCGINNTWPSGTPTTAQLLTQQADNSTTFSNVAQNGLTTLPASNSLLTFTPPAPSAAPSTLSFTSVGKIGMTLNWADNANNEAGYVIYSSTDNVTFNAVSPQFAANATSGAVTGLLPGTTYYFQVYAVTDGQLSSALTGSQATLAPSNIVSAATGLWSAGATWAGGIVPSPGDNVTIANGHTVTLDMSTTCNLLTIGGGASGQLTIGNNATARSLTLISDLTINAGAIMTIGTNSATHTMALAGNLVNNGTLNLAPSGSRVCNVTFNKNGNQTLSGSGSSTAFNLVTLNMGTSGANILNVTASNFGAASNFLTLTNGTFKLSAAVSMTPFTAAVSIPLSGGLWINDAGATVTTTGGTITLYGYIRATAGTLNIGNGSDHNLTSYGGTVIIEGATVNIAGRLDKAGPTVLTNFTLSSGQLTVANIGSTTASLAPFTIDEVGSTFNMSGGTIIIKRPGAGNLGFINTGGTIGSVTGGTLQIGNASTPPSQTFQINSSIAVPNLVIGSSVGVTAQLNTNSLVINNDLTVTSGSTFDLGTLNANRNTSGGTLTAAGTLLLGGTTGGQTGNNFPANFSTLTMTGGTVNYNKTAGGQTIYDGPAYNHLTVSNSSSSQTAAGALTVNGTLTTTAGGTLDMSTYTLGGTLATITNGGTIRTQNMSATPIPAGRTWTGTVEYGITTGGQTVDGTTYTNLKLSNTSGLQTADNDVTVNGTLTTTAGGKLDLSTYLLNGTLGTITNNGTIRTQNTSSTPIPSGKTWAGTIEYYAATGGQTVVMATYSGNLLLSNTSGTQTAAGAFTLYGSLTTNAGSTLDMSTYVLSTSATITNNGTVKTQNTTAAPLPAGKTWAGTVEYNAATGSQTVVGGTYNNVTLSHTSGTTAAGGSITVNGALTTSAGGVFDLVAYALGGTLGTITNNGTIRTQRTSTPIPASKTWGGTVEYNATTGGQPVMVGTYNNLLLSNTSGIQAAGGALTVNGALTVTAGGILNMGAYALGGTLSTLTNNGTIRTQNTTSTPLPSGRTWDGTVEYNTGTGAQTVMAGSYANLTMGNTSGTQTATGAITVDGTLITTAGGVLNMVTYTLGGTLATLTNNGTIRTQNTTSSAIPTGRSWAGTVEYSTTAGGQIIIPATYTNLKLSNTSGSQTAGNNMTVNGILTTTSGGIMDMSTYDLDGTLGTITNGGTLRTQSVSSAPIPSGKTWGGTVEYNTTAGGQTIAAGTYGILKVSNTSGSQTASGALTVNGTLTTTAGGILDMSTYALAGTLGTITNGGTIRTQNTSSTPVVTGKTWGGTMEYNAASGTQTIMTGTYNNLTLSHSSGTSTANGGITVNGTLVTASGGVFDLATNALAGTLATITNNGTIRTQKTATAFPNSKTWNGTIDYNATAGGQSVIIGTYNNLTMSNTSGTQTASGALTVNGTFTTTAGGTLNMTTFALSGTLGTITNAGIIRTQNTTATPVPTGKTWGGTLQYDGAAQTVSTGTYNNLILAGSAAKTITTASTTVNNLLSMEATATASAVITYGASATLQYNKPAGFTAGVEWLATFAASGGIVIANTGTITMNAAKVVNAPVAINTGSTLATNNLSLTFGGDFTNSGTFTAGSSPILISNNIAQSIAGFTTTGLVSMTKTGGIATMQGNINGAGFTINGSGGTLNLGSALTHTFTGVVTLTAGTLNGGSSTLNENAVSATAWNGTGSVFSAGTGTVNFSVAGAQTLAASATTFNNLTLGGSGAKTIITANCTVNGILSLEGSATISAAPTYGSAAALRYNIATSRTAGAELVTPFSGTGGVINAGAGTISLNADQVMNGPLTLSVGKLALGTRTLTLNADFSGSASACLVANGNTSALVIGGSGSMGSLYFDQTTAGTTNRIQNLTINRASQTITLGNTLEVTTAITPSAGTLAAAGNLTLVSNASATARVEAIGGSADITGTVKVQRYVPSLARRYRTLSPPTSAFTYNDLIDNMYVTGPGGASNGFDPNYNNSSVYTYQESTTGGRGWKAVPTIGSSLSAASGALVFVRGDRTLPSPDWYTQNNAAYPSSGGFPVQNPVTVDFNGPLNKGNYSPTLTYTNTGVTSSDGWNLVGNPYASPIDWTTISRSNLSAFYYAYDPATGSYIADNGSGYIASGQAFFVQATGASPTLTFTESCKTTSAATNYFKSAPQLLTIKMVKDTLNSDVAFLSFQAGADKLYNINEDALKFSNSLINFGWLSDSNAVQLQYSTVPELSSAADSFPLFATAAQGTYSFEFSGEQSISSNYKIFLKDRFTSTLVDIRSTPVYVFTITSNPASSGNDRFAIVFSNPSAALPVQLVSFSAKAGEHNQDVNVEWQTANEKNNRHFVVERSFNNTTAFEAITTVKGQVNSSTVHHYAYTDVNVFSNPAPIVYYRLKQVDLDGRSQYSEIAPVMRSHADLLSSDMAISIFPNPAVDFIRVTSPGIKPGAFTFRVIDVTGKEVRSGMLAAVDEAIDTRMLNKGMYFLVLQEEQAAIVKIGKFIK